jgi:polar amino acid transport system ATP-binding protein
MPLDNIFTVTNLHKSFGKLDVLKGISYEFKNGLVYSIIGPSGSGKSTLLRCLNFLEKPTRGEIKYKDKTLFGLNTKNKYQLLINEKELDQYRTQVGMVFQSFNLFNHMTVLDNVMIALTDLLKMDKEKAKEIALSQLDRVGIKDKALAYPIQISGGQKQRVAIARALAVSPQVLLFDEPTSALDLEMVKEVLEVIRSLAKTGITMLIVTHEIKFAEEVSDSILLMDDGLVVESNTPKELLHNPKNERTIKFLNAIL